MTHKEGAVEEGIQSLSAQGVRAANARDFTGQAVTLENVGDADAVVFPEIGVALVSGDAAQARGMSAHAEIAADSPIEAIEPEYFVFAEQTSTEYLRGFARATEVIARDLAGDEQREQELVEGPLVLGATWG